MCLGANNVGMGVSDLGGKVNTVQFDGSAEHIAEWNARMVELVRFKNLNGMRHRSGY